MEHTKEKLTWERIGRDNILENSNGYFAEVEFVLREDDDEQKQTDYMNHLIKCWNKYDTLQKKADSHDALLTTIKNALATVAIIGMDPLDNNVASNDELLKIMVKSFQQAIENAKES